MNKNQFSKQDLFDYEEWNIEIRKQTNKNKSKRNYFNQQIPQLWIRSENLVFIQTISSSLYFPLHSSPFCQRVFWFRQEKITHWSLSRNSEILKVELPRIKNAQMPPVGVDKSFLQTNQKKWDLTILEQTNCTAAFSTLNRLVVILFEVSWDKSWTVTSPYLADPSLGQYCG